MTRRILEHFVEVKITEGSFRKYLGKSMILILKEKLEDFDDDVYAGIITEIENNVLYMKNARKLDEETSHWIEESFDIFLKLDPMREDSDDPLKGDPLLRLEYIKSAYITKLDSTIDQICDMWIGPS